MLISAQLVKLAADQPEGDALSSVDSATCLPTSQNDVDGPNMMLVDGPVPSIPVSIRYSVALVDQAFRPAARRGSVNGCRSARPALHPLNRLFPLAGEAHLLRLDRPQLVLPRHPRARDRPSKRARLIVQDDRGTEVLLGG